MTLFIHDRVQAKKLHTSFEPERDPGMIKSRKMIQAKYVSCMADMRNANKIAVRISEGKRPLQEAQIYIKE
jgi:hypothetical protein